ncbi:MAG: hypothetical protein DCF19_14020 [Pseudanabaena frigida]|uniref:Uncharacterized protein n=1 Tax=Pseudanabaena frigida TaxID=945775 RepID=A0A2W4Y802_9CYAN|nr:MAG: hypothetical protein DCF19_14020 [Pseudanabaena frigida]
MIGLFELLQKVEKNSGMYLGRQSVSDLFMFLTGYEFARSQINEELTQEEEDFYNEFQPWLQKKLGVRSVTSWAKLIMLSCHDEKTGFEMFFKFLREFQVRHAEILANAQEVQQAFKDGTAKRGSVDDLLADLLG